MKDHIKLPPLHYDELPEADDVIPAMHNYARKAIEADRQRRSELAVWCPIDTAPKYEPILTLTKHGVIEGEWDGEFVNGYYGRDMQWYASYWMPLPEPPKGQPPRLP